MVCFSFIFCNDPGFLTSFCERRVWSDGSYSDPAPEQFQFWGCFYLVIESPSTRDQIMLLLSFGCGCLLNLPQIKRSALHKICPPPPQKINFPLKIYITLET